MNLRRVFALVTGGIALATIPAKANITFNLMPEDGTPQFAIDGFQAAANLWSAVIADNITVNLQIGFTNLAPNVIGEAGSDGANYSYTATLAALASHRTSADDFSSYAALQPGSSYSRLINHTSDNGNSATPYVDTMNIVGVNSATAKALGLLGSTSTPDGVIRFSSAINFDFDRNNGIDSDKYDFIGAAAHEIGHTLGFISGVDDIDANEGVDPGSNFSSNLIDLFRYSALSISTGTGFTDYTADTRAKYFSVDGGTNQIALFSTGVTHGDGHQASHWKDNLGIGIMDPTGAAGELLLLSINDLRIMDTLGYSLVPEPTSIAIGVAGLVLAIGLRRRRREGF